MSLTNHPRLRAILNLDAWVMILIGLVLFGACTPLQASAGGVNLPLLATVLQLSGFMFTMAGLQVMLSLLVWPQVSVAELLQHAVQQGDFAAGVILLGLFIYNGLCMIAFVLWVGATAFGVGVAG